MFTLARFQKSESGTSLTQDHCRPQRQGGVAGAIVNNKQHSGATALSLPWNFCSFQNLHDPDANYFRNLNGNFLVRTQIS